jgi:hypothetical protein
MKLKYLALFISSIFFLLCFVGLFGIWLQSDEQAKKDAEASFELELNSRSLKRDFFGPISFSRDGLGWIASWTSIKNENANLGISSLPWSYDFTASPVFPDCRNRREDTLKYFGINCG